MELSEEQKQQVINILSKADGEDMDEIVRAIGMEDYLFHSLMMSASENDINYNLDIRSAFDDLKH